MGLETGTYISSLVATNPVTGDNKTEGDDHLRLIKSTVLATFPNITGAVTPTHTELNKLTGIATKALVIAYLSGNQASGTTLQFDSEILDLGSNFNASTYTFTAPATAYYRVDFFAWVTNTSGGAADFQVLLNSTVAGGAIASAAAALPDNGSNQLSISGVFPFTAADTITLVSSYTLTASKVVRGGTYSRFCIEQIIR